jgi:formyltetrahydrofolate synthetase
MKLTPGLRRFIPTPLELKNPVPADIDIAQAATLKPIAQVAEEMGLLPGELELYGDYKAKIKLEVLERLADAPDGKYIDVTAITPTPLGEGKNLPRRWVEPGNWRSPGSQCHHLHPPAIARTNLWHQRWGCGGGYSQVIPMEDFNLHLTGDIHAIRLPNNCWRLH